MNISDYSWVMNNSIIDLSVAFNENANISEHFFANLTKLEKLTIQNMPVIPSLKTLAFYKCSLKDGLDVKFLNLTDNDTLHVTALTIDGDEHLKIKVKNISDIP